MNVVLIKNHDYIHYNISNLIGYKFYPKRYIKNLVVINFDLLKLIIYIKVNEKIEYIRRTIYLMINSNATIIDDCVMMEKELYNLVSKINKKYINYLDDNDYDSFINNIYKLNMQIDLKKRIIISNN